jgi:hypothetical protein
VWSSIVVVGPPAAKRGAGLGQGREQRLVQELIPQSTIEALDECVLHRFAWRDVVPGNSALVRPCEYGVAGEFTSIVADHQALPGTIIHDSQNAEAATAGELVRYKVERSPIVRHYRKEHRRSGPDRPLAAAATAHRQLLLPIEPEKLLMVDHVALPL